MQVTTLKVQDANGNIVEIPVGQLLQACAALFTITSKGNLQITSPKNINVEPTKSLKVKTGVGAQIELLSDHNTDDRSEFLIKTLCGVDAEGTELETALPIRLKINSTELELNTKDATDTNPYDVKFKTGLKSSKNGEHYCQTKLKGRSFDIRCYEHGGIALQPCGHDGSGHENKIKFESSRTSQIGSDGEYVDEGGKGLEFGTFNNEHTSLFTGDYRFNANGMVYAVTRQTPVYDPTSEKTDYPTQTDDFKDVIDPSLGVTWGDIVRCAKAWKASNQ